VLPPEHPLWTLPLRWKGARDPLLGAGMPSLCFVSSMNELFLPERLKEAREVIDRTIGMIAISNHIGLILSKQPEQMAAYFTSQPEIIQQRWQSKFWLGFS